MTVKNSGNIWQRDWAAARKFCLQIKYDQCEEFRKTLNETAGRYIVEDQTHGKTSKTTGKVKPADSWGVVLTGDKYVGSNLLGRLLMELRENGTLKYNLPDDMFVFLDRI